MIIKIIGIILILLGGFILSFNLVHYEEKYKSEIENEMKFGEYLYLLGIILILIGN